MDTVNNSRVSKTFVRAAGLLIAALLFGASPAARAGQIYVLTNGDPRFDGATTNFGTIDTTTGAYTNIATLSGAIGNLAWNPAARNFFVTSGASTATTLHTLTTTATLSTSLGTVGKTIYGMAYRTADSTLYGYDFGGDDTVTINPATGALAVLNASPGLSSGPPLGGRYSILGDTLYFAYAGNQTGFGTLGFTASSQLVPIVSNTTYINMALAHDGTTMYGLFANGTAGDQRLYTIDTTTGVLTAGPAISGTGLGTYFHGAAVPEPATYLMALTGLACGGYLVRRRPRPA